MLLSKLDRSGVGGGDDPPGVTEAHTVKMWLVNYTEMYCQYYPFV